MFLEQNNESRQVQESRFKASRIPNTCTLKLLNLVFGKQQSGIEVNKKPVMTNGRFWPLMAWIAVVTYFQFRQDSKVNNYLMNNIHVSLEN